MFDELLPTVQHVSYIHEDLGFETRVVNMLL